MENQFKRKLAAFLAIVMFTTSLPVPVVAEDSVETIPVVTVDTAAETTPETTMTLPSEPETVPTTVPETEPATESVTEPETEPTTEPVTEPATERTTKRFVSEQVTVASDTFAAAVHTQAVDAVLQKNAVLENPLVSMPDSVKAGEEVTVTWETVENAEEYVVMLYWDDGTYIGDIYYGSETSATISRQLEAGEYMVTVLSRAEGWENGGSNVFFTVTGELPASPALRLDAASYTAGSKVTYVITAEGAEVIRLRYYGTTEDGYNSDDTYEFAADGTTTTYEKYFYTTGNFNAVCSVKVNGKWSAWSEPVPFAVSYLGELVTPVLSMKENYTAGEEITVSWTAIENAEGYIIFLYNDNGQRIDNWWVNGPENSISIDTVLDAGTYQLSVRATADGWKESESEKQSFTVAGMLAEGPSFAADKTTVITGNEVTFTVSMVGATAFRMQYNNNIREYEAENGTATITQTLYGADEVVTVRFSACVDGIWTAYGPAQEITVQNKPTLGNVNLVLPESIRAAEEIAITWTAVENAEYYYINVNTGSGDHVWSDTMNAQTGDCTATIPGTQMKQGTYVLTVTATAAGYNQSKTSLDLVVGAPALGNEFRCTFSSDGTQAYMYEYNGDPTVAELEIPATINGATVVGIYGSKFLNNNGTLKKVTIPKTLTYIADEAFAGSTDLTIRGYSGSDAEEFALLNGYGFEAMDSGETSVTARWEGDVLVNSQLTILISAAGATDIRMRVDSSVEYFDSLVLTQEGAKLKWTPPETGEHFIRFEAWINDEWVTSRNYPLTVTSLGQMPQVAELAPSAPTVEPGTEVTLTWKNPEGLAAPEYSAGVKTPAYSTIYWYSVTAGDTGYTFRQSLFDDEGTYTLYVRTEPLPGYEASVASCTVEVTSTKTWDLIASTGELVGYHGTDKDITIPAQIDGVAVKTIGSDLFADGDITSVIIPEGVSAISASAFENCSALTDVVLPSTLKTIGQFAFENCTSLQTVTLPDSLYSLGWRAFNGCESLTEIVIPEKVTKLEDSVFADCTGLSKVTLPDSLISIGYGTFARCTSLKSITIPQSVTTIRNTAFANMMDLTICGYSGTAAETFAEEQGFTFIDLGAAQAGDISFTLKSDTVYNHGNLVLLVTAPNAEKLRLHLDGDTHEYDITGGKAELSRYVYGEGQHTVAVSQWVEGKWLSPCEAKTFTVTELGIPEPEDVGTPTAGTALTIRWKPVTGAVEYTLFLDHDNENVAVYSGITAVDEDGYVYQQLSAEDLSHEGLYTMSITARAADEGQASYRKSFEVIAAQKFTYTVNADGAAVITGYTGTEVDVTVPEILDGYTVTSIGANAFRGSAAMNVTLPDTVKVVQTHAFRDCEGLQSVTIAGAQAVIKNAAFDGCTKLTSITVGTGIFAESGAFAGCRTDTTVYGYAGGQVEEEAKKSCKFSSLGELAAGPVIAAEDIWQNEKLNYSVSHENAVKLYIQEIYPDGNVESSTYVAEQLEDVADSRSFADLTETSYVTIKAAALVNGEWTAYTEKNVTVSVLKKLTAPVFDEIGVLERHVAQVIKWYPVEGAEQYRVIISSGMHVVDHDETVEIPEITLKAGSLQEGNYTIRVTAMAEGCEDATGSAEFEMISLKLDQPVITVDKRIARHLGAKITWEPVPIAENYTVVVQTEGINGPLTLYRNTEQTETEVTLTPEQLKVGNCTVSVTANALYCTSSDTATAEFEIYEEQLDVPEVTAPEAVVGGVAFDVTWKSVENAERYSLEIMNGKGYRVFNKTVDSNTLSQTVLLDAYLPEETLTLRVIASANYRVNGVAEQPLSYEPLYTYEIVDNAAVITGYNGPDMDLTIPDRIKGYAVTAIGDDAFAGMDEITKVRLPGSVQSIGNRSFKNCTALAWIEGDGVEKVGREAFCNCSSLVHIRFGGNDEAVKAEPDAFENTPVVNNPDEWLDVTVSQITVPTNEDLKDYSFSLFLSSITYEEGITHIPARTHYSNLMLKEVYLPKSLRTIGSEAFAECPSLDYVRVYDGITEIAEDAFENAPNLCLHIYTEEYDEISYVEQYAIDHNILYVKHDLTQRYFYSMTYPDGTVAVEEKDLFADDYLLTVSLPETVKTIGSQAFAQCNALHTVSLYDGVTSIAEDVFEGSDGVRLVIYVQDLDTVSYAEQYAIDHEIPYEKYLRPGESSAVVDLRDGDTSPVTVNIDESVFIGVADIPVEADRLLVYLDEELIYAPALDQNTTIQFTHIFRDFGEHILTAEAYLGEEKIKTSLEKPVTVVGIRLQADKETAWTCETVNFTVEAYPETGELSFYAEDLRFGTVRLTNNVGSLAHAFTKAGDREITARSADGRVSRTLILPIQCIGQLDKPVLEAEELQYLKDGLVCSWNTTEHTDGYVLYVRAANGVDLVQRNIVDDGSARMSCRISEEELGGAATFELYLMNYGYQYDQNESETLTVEHVCEYKTTSTTKLVNQNKTHHTVETTTYEECSICHEKTKPVTSVEWEEHKAERTSYESKHPHQKFLVCKCGACPYITGQFHTANGKVQEKSVCCICNGHKFGDAKETSGGIWKKTCGNCGITQKVAAPVQPTEPEDKTQHVHAFIKHSAVPTRHPHFYIAACSCGAAETNHEVVSDCCLCVGHDWGDIVRLPDGKTFKIGCFRCNTTQTVTPSEQVKDFYKIVDMITYRHNAAKKYQDEHNVNSTATAIWKTIADQATEQLMDAGFVTTNETLNTFSKNSSITGAVKAIYGELTRETWDKQQTDLWEKLLLKMLTNYNENVKDSAKEFKKDANTWLGRLKKVSDKTGDILSDDATYKELEKSISNVDEFITGLEMQITVLYNEGKNTDALAVQEKLQYFKDKKKSFEDEIASAKATGANLKKSAQGIGLVMDCLSVLAEGTSAAAVVEERNEAFAEMLVHFDNCITVLESVHDAALSVGNTNLADAADKIEEELRADKEQQTQKFLAEAGNIIEESVAFFKGAGMEMMKKGVVDGFNHFVEEAAKKGADSLGGQIKSAGTVLKAMELSAKGLRSILDWSGAYDAAQKLMTINQMDATMDITKVLKNMDSPYMVELWGLLQAEGCIHAQEFLNAWEDGTGLNSTDLGIDNGGLFGKSDLPKVLREISIERNYYITALDLPLQKSK